MTTEEQIRELLHPHYGHLKFLLKIKDANTSIDDIEQLLLLIKDKSLICHLPKQVHQYGSYYTLMKDLYFTDKNRFVLAKIKNETASNAKVILMELLSDDNYSEKLEEIFHDKDLCESFFRWSSRINSRAYAKTYIDSVLNDADILRYLNGTGSTLVELTDYQQQKNLLPSSWCLTNESTFYNYVRKQRIFLFNYEGCVFGINVISDNGYEREHNRPRITIQNSNNKTIQKGEGFQDSTNMAIYKAAYEELLKLKLFGIETIVETKIKTEKKMIRNKNKSSNNLWAKMRRMNPWG